MKKIAESGSARLAQANPIRLFLIECKSVKKKE
jgi:hypothetical protein